MSKVLFYEFGLCAMVHVVDYIKHRIPLYASRFTLLISINLCGAVNKVMDMDFCQSLHVV
jgi:hypothetical protein